MRSASRWAVMVLAAAGLGVFAMPAHGEEPATQPSADAQAATGTITGTVMKDGKPLANARVGLIDAAQMKQRLGKHAKGQASGATTQTQQRQRPTPTATAMTDSDGKFTLSDVKAGDYMIMAMARGEGHGRTRTSVSAGQTANVDIQITQSAGGGKGGKGGGKTAKTGNAK